jgi:molybdenum cofactor biosynthesis protein B
MSSVPQQHRKEGPAVVRCVVVTISDTRTLETDTGGGTIVSLLEAAGHQVLDRLILRDEPEQIREALAACCRCADVDAVLLTGGTGLGSRDQTVETLSTLLTKPLPGYGELFRMLSFQEIGPAAMLSRGVRLAMERLILPELGHLVREARR